jgi:excisionase family DNA binding protein
MFQKRNGASVKDFIREIVQKRKTNDLKLDELGSDNFNFNNGSSSSNRYSRAVEDSSESSTLLFNNLIWLTTEEAARFLRKSNHALRQMLYKDRISARKLHGRLYFKKSELHELIDTSHF